MAIIQNKNAQASSLIALMVSLAVLPAASALGDGSTSPETVMHVPVPLGLDSPLPIPDDNPSTPEKIALGRKIFFDPILSRSGSTSCSTCHQPEFGFSGNTPLPTGIEGAKGRRNAPSLLNRAYAQSLFWDGRAATLEIQALEPIQNPAEMGMSLSAVLRRLQTNADYVREFKAVFSDGISTQNVARALASFERTLLTGNSPVDQFRNSKFSALSEPARQGLWLFESRGLCWKCHSGRNFTDERFHNTGVSWGKAPADLGRFEISRKEEERGSFKTPSLRDVSKTAPYMHDGSLASLRDVVEFYSRGGTQNPKLDPILKPLNLSEDEVKNLVSFLEALTGEVAPAPQLK